MATMKIALFCNGTRGDFQPYLSLAIHMRQDGHSTLFFTGSDHCKMAVEFGFEAVHTAGDMETFLRGDACKKAMEKGDFAICAGAAKEIYNAEDPAVLKERIKEHLASFPPDLVLHNSLGFVNTGEMVAELLPGMPTIQVELQPQGIPSEKYKSGAFQRELPDPETPNAITFLWPISNPGHVEAWQELLNTKSKEECLESMDKNPTPERFFEMTFEPSTWLLPRFLAYSPSFWPNPADWPKTDNIQVLGNFKISKAVQDEYAAKGSKYFSEGADYARCKEFIERVGPPVYLGWGSMVVYTKEHMTKLAVEACKRAGEKAIILAGWAQLGPEGLEGAENEEELRAWCEENILFIKAAPHELLFPQCKAAIHHGGIGTLQASLSAGCPTIITPVFADQFDNARHLHDIECGTYTKQLGKLKSKELGDAIKTVCTEPKFQAKAKALSEAMLKEDGVSKMAAWLVSFHTEEVVTGKYAKRQLEDKERLFALRQKNHKLDFNRMQTKWQSVITPRFPSIKEWVGKNMRFLAIASDLAGKDKLWVVQAQSVLAREGKALDSEEVGKYKKYAFLEELEKDQKGTRVHVKKMKGRGPDEGWLTATVKGKEMLHKVTNPMEIGMFQAQEFQELFSDIYAALAENEKHHREKK